jgi:hypothetical protein
MYALGRSLWGMGKALAAVGTFLVLCIAVLAGVSYFARDESRIAVDSVLAAKLSKEFVAADQEGSVLDLKTVTDFDWDRVLIYPPGTRATTVDRALGFEFTGDLPYTAESSEVLVFTNKGKFVRFADYRGRGRFEGLQRPTMSLTADEAVFQVHDGIARLAR